MSQNGGILRIVTLLSGEPGEDTCRGVQRRCRSPDARGDRRDHEHRSDGRYSIGIARSALDNYVTGKRAIPVPVVYAVCADLGVEPHVLFARAEERLRADGDYTARASTADPPRTRCRRPTREDTREVAFESGVRHDADTDDLYE